jgi:hypothetical protein
MDEDDDIDDMDTESIADSMHGEQNPSIQQVVPTSDATISIPTDLIIDVHEDVKVTKTDLLNSRPLSSSNKSLASSTPSIHQLKINPIEHQTKPKLLTPASVVKKGRREFSKKSMYHFFFFLLQFPTGNYRYHRQLFHLLRVKHH